MPHAGPDMLKGKGSWLTVSGRGLGPASAARPAGRGAPVTVSARFDHTPTELDEGYSTRDVAEKTAKAGRCCTSTAASISPPAAAAGAAPVHLPP